MAGSFYYARALEIPTPRWTQDPGRATRHWQRRRYGETLERIERLRAGLERFDRCSSLLQGWALGLFSAEDEKIA